MRVERIEIEPGRRLAVVRFPAAAPKATALFDAGAFGPFIDGYWICTELARQGISAATYSRAGLHQSDPLPKGAVPDPLFHAADMARLLDALGVAEPTLMVGHSMAGLRLHAFAAACPDRMGAALFIDAVTPRQLALGHRRAVARMGSGALPIYREAMRLRALRPVMRLYPNNMKFGRAERDDKTAAWSDPDHIEGTRQELWASSDRALADRLPPITHCPVGVVTATTIAHGYRGLLDAARRSGHPTRHLSLPKTGHAAVLAPGPAVKIAGLGAWLAGRMSKSPRDIAATG